MQEVSVPIRLAPPNLLPINLAYASKALWGYSSAGSAHGMQEVSQFDPMHPPTFKPSLKAGFLLCHKEVSDLLFRSICTAFCGQYELC